MDDKLPIRPTSDKARGAVFSSIAELIPDALVLDVFAGTGAIGIEALSRGARRVVAVEASSKVAELISRNREALGISRESLSVMVGSFERELAKLKGTEFDVIFADPPYGKGYAQQVINLVGEYGLLQPSGILIIEHFAKELVAETVGSLRRIKTKNYGQTEMSYYHRMGEGV